MQQQFFAIGPAPAERERRAAKPRLAFRNADDFGAARHAAVTAACNRFGPRWVFTPGASVFVTIPRQWVTTGLRDRRVPTAEYWPGGRLPHGLVIAPPPPPAGPPYPDPVTPEAVAAWAAAHGLVRVNDLWLEPTMAALERCRLRQIVKDHALREAAALARAKAEADAEAKAAPPRRTNPAPDVEDYSRTYSEGPDIVAYLETVEA